MGDWDNLVEPARGALEALLRKGDEMADRIEELEANLAKAMKVLDEAVYLLAPDEKNMVLTADAYWVVTTFKELKGQDDAVLHGD